jgi:hypothetical protein
VNTAPGPKRINIAKCIDVPGRPHGELLALYLMSGELNALFGPSAAKEVFLINIIVKLKRVSLI